MDGDPMIKKHSVFQMANPASRTGAGLIIFYVL